MSTNQEKDPEGPQISIPIPSSSDSNDDDKSKKKIVVISNNGDNIENRGKSNNRFKRFDAKKREEIIISCNCVAFFLAACICVGSFTIPALKNSRPRGIAMWQWSLLATVLLVGPLLSKAIVPIVLYFKDKDFSARENILYYVAGLVESAWVVVWFTMILVAWLIVVDEPDYLGLPRDKSEKIIKKFDTTFPIISITLVTFILGSFLWLLKDLMLMRTKSSFHIRRFFDRIKEALMHQSVVETLSPPPPPPTMINKNDVNNLESVKAKKRLSRIISFGRKKNKVTIDVSCFDEVTQENVSCWGMKKVIQWLRENQYLIYYDKDNKPTRIDSEEKAQEAAKYIFQSLVHDQDQDSYIEPERLKKHLQEKIIEEIKTRLLEGADCDAHITKEILTEWMVKAYEYRKSLVNALKANRKQFRTFNRIINVLLVFLIFALWLIMLRVETRKVIFVIGSAIVGSAFIFGETCKKIFENFLFVFIVHPFDIGDWCDFGDTRVVIKEIGVLSTTVLTHDNVMKHYSNSHLADQTISNYTRSAHMGDYIEFPLKIDTPTENVNALEEKINSLIKEKFESSQYWYKAHHWEMVFQDTNTMKLTLHFQHRFNHHDFHERQLKKLELFKQIKDILNDLIKKEKDLTTKKTN